MPNDNEYAFDTRNLPERTSNPFDPIPSGKQIVALDKAEKKALKNADNGHRLACEFTILRGEYEGRKLFKSFNLWHNAPPKEPGKPSAKQIAEWEFADLMKACGKEVVRNFEELYNIPVEADVKLRPASNGFEAQNEIKTFRAEGTPAKPAATTGNGPARAPWSGKK